VTNTKCCRYSYMRSWWWVEVPPETCRAVSRYNKLCKLASCWMYIGICFCILFIDAFVYFTLYASVVRI